LYWLRASMAAGTAGVCDTAGIHPGAVAACLAEDGTALEDPLPAGSIKRLVETLPGIAVRMSRSMLQIRDERCSP
jgi:hypothetical protein